MKKIFSVVTMMVALVAMVVPAATDEAMPIDLSFNPEFYKTDDFHTESFIEENGVRYAVVLSDTYDFVVRNAPEDWNETGYITVELDIGTGRVEVYLPDGTMTEQYIIDGLSL